MKIGIAVLVICVLSGCATTPGIVPALGGRTVIEREFFDSDSKYTESIKAPAGVEVDKLSRFSLKLDDGSTKYEVGMNSADNIDSLGQADLLSKISSDTVEMMASITRILESIVPAILSQGGTPKPGSNPVLTAAEILALIQQFQRDK